MRSDSIRRDLKHKAVRGLAVTGASQACNFFIRFGSTMLLARLLRPDDFGLIAMACAVVAVITYAGDLGLSEATIQRGDVTHEQLSALFWVNVGVGLALALVNVALAPVLVLFYGDERILLVSIVLGAEFLFRGLSYQHQAILNRTMRFRAVAVVNVVSIALGTLATIVAALCGLGYWSLVIWQLAPALVFLIGMWTACNWRPGLPAYAGGVRSLLVFGGNLTFFNVLNAVSQNADKILLGHRWGAHSVGVYSKGFQLVLLAYQQVFFPLARVVVPTLSRLVEEPERYEKYYCKTLGLIAYATLPMLVLFGVLGEEVVLLVLGSQWAESAPILQILCLATFGKAIVDSTNWVAISTGNTRRMLVWGLVTTPVLVGAFAVGARWGGLGVAWAYAVCILLLSVPKVVLFLRNTPVSKGAVLRAIYCPLAISVVMVVPLYHIRGLVESSSVGIVCLVTGLAAMSLFFIAVFAWPKARREVADLMSTVRLLRQRGGGQVGGAEQGSSSK